MKSVILFTLLSVRLCSISQEFPQDFLGNYTGTMIISSTSNVHDTAQVTFNFKEQIKDSVWGYRMVISNSKYGEVVKDYALVAKKKGRFRDFIFDELNGIKMEMSFLNYCLYGMYEVSGTFYISTFRILNEDLLFDLMIAPKENYLETKFDEDESFVVQSFKPTLQQTVLLKSVD